MTKKTTKRALLMSALSLVLCLSMLIGTTFAWFSDSVSSGSNKIVAGNLDVDLQVKVDDAWKSVEDIDDDSLFAVDLWEPGVVAYETFKAINLGNLALKYNMYLSFSNANTVDGKSLADVIKVALIDGELDDETRADLIESAEWQNITNSVKVTDGNLDVEEEDIYTVVAYWAPTNNDNDYNLNNGKKADNDEDTLHINFAVTLAATQDTVEEDSFDDQYDAGATLSGVDAMVDVINQGAADANAAVANAIKDILADPSNSAWADEYADVDISELIYFDDELALNDETNEYEITLHFEAYTLSFVDATYDAVKALIGTAVDAQAGNIYSISIAEREARVLNGQSSGADDIAQWVEDELKAAVDAGGNGLAGALQASDQGIPVEVIDMDGNAQTYRMYFDLKEGWNSVK